MGVRRPPPRCPTNMPPPVVLPTVRKWIESISGTRSCMSRAISSSRPPRQEPRPMHRASATDEKDSSVIQAILRGYQEDIASMMTASMSSGSYRLWLPGKYGDFFRSAPLSMLQPKRRVLLSSMSKSRRTVFAPVSQVSASSPTSSRDRIVAVNACDLRLPTGRTSDSGFADMPKEQVGYVHSVPRPRLDQFSTTSGELCEDRRMAISRRSARQLRAPTTCRSCSCRR